MFLGYLNSHLLIQYCCLYGVFFSFLLFNSVCFLVIKPVGNFLFLSNC